MATLQNLDWLRNYTAPTPVQTGAQWSSNYLKPISDVTTDIIGKYKVGVNKSKIDEIIADETQKASVRKGMTPVDSEGNAIGGPAKGELDYKALERRLLPYDQELSAKYGVLAEKQATTEEANKLKREQFDATAKAKIETELAKKQELTNKFNLSTEQGKLAWKDQFNKLQIRMTSQGFGQMDPETVVKPITNQMQSLINQAQDYPELLSSVGLQAKTTEPQIEEPKQDLTKLGTDHVNNIAILDKLIEKKKYKSDDISDLISFVNKGNIGADEVSKLNSYIKEQVGNKPNKPGAAKSDQQIVDDLAKTFGVGPLQQKNTQFGLYTAGISNFKQGNYGTAIQNFIKTANPGESVMSDDVNMANIGTMTDAFKSLAQKFGVNPAGLNVEQIASKLKNTADLQVKNTIEGLNSYGMTPEQTKLFIIQKLSGKTVLDNLDKDIAIGTTKKQKIDGTKLRSFVKGKKYNPGELVKIGETVWKMDEKGERLMERK